MPGNKARSSYKKKGKVFMVSDLRRDNVSSAKSLRLSDRHITSWTERMSELVLPQLWIQEEVVYIMLL